MFKKLWDTRLINQSERTNSLKDQSHNIERKINTLLERIIEIEEPSVIARFEQKIKTLENEKIVIAEKIKNCGKPLRPYSEAYRTAIEFLSNPYKLWASGRLENQHTVMKLAFADRLTYERFEGYRTAKTTLPFSMLGGFCSSNEKMVGRTGFEPVTNWLKANCSTD